ncbi:hypothetical protein Tco_0011129 [Tanacetum coccineum]
MIDELSIVETDKVNHTVETDMMKLVVEIECFGVNFDEFDKETGSSDELQPNQADLNCVHALNEPHLHEIHVVPNKHEADRYPKYALSGEYMESVKANREDEKDSNDIVHQGLAPCTLLGTYVVWNTRSLKSHDTRDDKE